MFLDKPTPEEDVLNKQQSIAIRRSVKNPIENQIEKNEKLSTKYEILNKIVNKTKNLFETQDVNEQNQLFKDTKHIVHYTNESDPKKSLMDKILNRKKVIMINDSHLSLVAIRNSAENEFQIISEENTKIPENNNQYKAYKKWLYEKQRLNLEKK